MDNRLSFKRKAIFLLLSSLLILISAYLFHSLYEDLLPKSKITQKIQKQLLKKEAEVDLLLSDFLEKFIESDSLPDFLSAYNALPEFDRKNITICIFRSDSLIFWTDNTIQVDPKFEFNPFNKNFLNISNGWFDLRKKTNNSTVVLGFIKVKMNYPYENDHLSNSFATYLSAPDEIKIRSNQSSYNAYNTEGDFLFGLDYSDHATISPYLESMLALAFILAYLILLTAIYYAYKLIALYIKHKYLLFAGLALDILLIRFLLLYFDFPLFIDHSQLFNPEYFASSFWTPSMGDLYINLVSLFVIGYAFFRLFSYKELTKKLSSNQKVLLANLSILFIFISFYLLINGLNSIVINSSISFNLADITSISLFSIAGFVCFSLHIFIFYLFTFKLSLFLFRVYAEGWKILIQLLVYFVLGFIIAFTYPQFTPLHLIFLGLYFGVAWYIVKNSSKNIMFSSTVMFILLFATLSTFLLNKSVQEKEKANRSFLAQNLLNQRDPKLEYTFSQAQERILSDTVLPTLLEKFPFDDFGDYQYTYDYTYNAFFASFSAHSDVWLSFCDSTSYLDLAADSISENCFNYFYQAIDDFGEQTEYKNLYFINNTRDEDNYLGVIVLPPPYDNLRLFVEIFNKYISPGIGYPELLVEKRQETGVNLSDYSFSMYENGVQINQFGSYLFALNLADYNLPDTASHFFDMDGFSHLLYSVDHENAILISLKNPGFIDLIAPFSYISIFLGFMAFLFFLFFRGSSGLRFSFTGFRKQMQFSITAILVVSFLFVGIGSLFYIITINHNKNISILQEKSNSVLIELKHKLENEEELTKENESFMTGILFKFSQVFFTDINLYDLNGQLLATSRREIFRKGLASKIMDPTAFLNMHSKGKPQFIHEEKIGEYKYLSAYIPFRNKNSRLIAYLNLPYFAKQDELTNEISTFLVAFINIYVLLIAFSIYLALVISNYITKPIELIREKIGKLKLGNTGEKIEWKRQDEIGSLITEYNRMVDELANSAELLARSERESAWREMAKQIAHEIKNPLTPMKLSAQYLQKAWDEQSPDWDDRLKRFTNTIIEQINSLSVIASEFSDFAKMPRSNFQQIDLAVIINNAIGTFKESSRVNFEFQPRGEFFVNADKEQLLRVFNNLIQNSIQAISNPDEGLIKIALTTDDSYHRIEFHDNGKGIPESMQEKVFYPNFTTKSGGMGLGLALVKNIIENAGGTITFESLEGTGTTFFIALPGKAMEV